MSDTWQTPPPTPAPAEAAPAAPEPAPSAPPAPASSISETIDGLIAEGKAIAERHEQEVADLAKKHLDELAAHAGRFAEEWEASHVPEVLADLRSIAERL